MGTQLEKVEKFTELLKAGMLDEYNKNHGTGGRFSSGGATGGGSGLPWDGSTGVHMPGSTAGKKAAQKNLRQAKIRGADRPQGKVSKNSNGEYQITASN